MEINKENLEELRNDPLMHLIANLFGTNLNELVNNAVKELDEKEKVEQQTKKVTEEMHKKEAEKKERVDTLKEMLERAGFEVINNSESGTTYKKNYTAPKCVDIPSFVMSKEQFVKFINNYTTLINTASKIEYLYGISFNHIAGQFNFTSIINTIIWDFVRIIFGDENADDIADFIYGKSNFDSAEQLYDELV